ncbi:hypothetical protein PSHT_13058 [Puccinia striiformis]|uniref:Ketoreductase (KR) domain-containing protein n=1 Tax=Puccinia striiformis TaxID=27350 RepID=A0A2S4USV4_9BASI|nr:hypothetical protein PSHT_13058 [Puccinia striiformis]
MSLASPQCLPISSPTPDAFFKVVHGRIAVITGGGTGLGESYASSFIYPFRFLMAHAWVVNGGLAVITARREEVIYERVFTDLTSISERLKRNDGFICLCHWAALFQILSKTCERLNQLGTGRAEYIVSDVSSKTGCVALCDELKTKFDKIHVLVNNSGTIIPGKFHEYCETDWDSVFNLNVKSIFYMTTELTPLLAKDATNLADLPSGPLSLQSTDPGRVIIISSANAFNNHSPGEDYGMWSYNSSKAAGVSLATNLAVTLGPKLITVNAICPGLFPSSMTKGYLKNADQEAIKAQHPMGRYGAVERKPKRKTSACLPVLLTSCGLLFQCRTWPVSSYSWPVVQGHTYLQTPVWNLFFFLFQQEVDRGLKNFARMTQAILSDGGATAAGKFPR